MTVVLVNKVLDALEIPVPVHRADARLRHRCICEKEPTRSSFTQAARIFAWAKQSFAKKIIKGEVDLENSLGERDRKWSSSQRKRG